MPRKPKTSRATLEAIKRYQAKFQDIRIRVPIGKKDMLRQYATCNGWESMTQFIEDMCDYAILDGLNANRVKETIRRRNLWRF